jgi:hypothetical protein
MPLHCANQAYSYYERDDDLDLNSQELILAAQECFLRICSWGDPPLPNLGIPFRPEEGRASLKKSDAAEEMHRAGGFRNTARWLKGNSKLVE